MIRIRRGSPPATLTRLGPGWTARHEASYDAHRDDYSAGESTMRIAAHVYGADDVREALVDMQHGKCCYCEVAIEHPYMQRHVEHWRPKGGVRQEAGDPELLPGYYWLAYDWDNLLLACVACNSLYKGTIFPLADPAARARDHRDDVGAETPLLLKPDVDDPDEHIVWENDQPRGLSAAGWSTIEVVGLIRPRDAMRTPYFAQLQRAYDRLWKIHGVDDPAVREIADEYRTLLRDVVRPETPFSAMARAWLEARPPAP